MVKLIGTMSNYFKTIKHADNFKSTDAYFPSGYSEIFQRNAEIERGEFFDNVQGRRWETQKAQHFFFIGRRRGSSDEDKGKEKSQESSFGFRYL